MVHLQNFWTSGFNCKSILSFFEMSKMNQRWVSVSPQCGYTGCTIWQLFPAWIESFRIIYTLDFVYCRAHPYSDSEECIVVVVHNHYSVDAAGCVKTRHCVSFFMVVVLSPTTKGPSSIKQNITTYSHEVLALFVHSLAALKREIRYFF